MGIKLVKFIVAEDGNEHAAYINPSHVICIAEGYAFEEPRNIGDYKTTIECRGNKYFNSNEDIEVVKQKLQGE